MPSAETIQSIADTVIKVIGAGAAIGVPFVYKWTRTRVIRGRQVVREIRSSVAMIPQISARVETIEHQYKFNGGDTLRDRVELVLKMVAMSVGAGRVLSDGLSYGVLEVDEKGYVQWTNSRLRRFTGLDPQEALGYGWMSAVVDEDREDLRTEWTRAISDKRFTRMRVTLENVVSNARCVALIEVHPITDAKREAVGFIALVFHREREQCETPTRREYEQPNDDSARDSRGG